MLTRSVVVILQLTSAEETEDKQGNAHMSLICPLLYVYVYRSLGKGEEEAYDIEEFRLRIVDKEVGSTK